MSDGAAEIPFVRPGVWPEVGASRFAATIVREHAADNPLLQGEFASAIQLPAIGLLGLPDDTGVRMNGGRPGAAEGPTAFRAALAKYGARWSDDLPRVLDCGDVIVGADLDETHARVTAATEAIIARGLFPVAIGGGHDLTFPFVRAACNKLGVKAGLYLDAHLDVRAEKGSGMPFRALVKQCGVKRLLVVGCDTLANSWEHADWFRLHGGVSSNLAAESMREIHDDIKELGEPCFVSVDLDALDAAHAPGVSALNPNGMTVREAARYAWAAGESAQVQCFDIMELNPKHDEQGRTARVAAHLFLTFAMAWYARVRAGDKHP